MSEEQEKIQRYIIKSAPFGELTEVLKDLDKISSVDFSSPALNTTIEEYNQDHLALANHQGEYLVLMSNCKIGHNKYLDQLRERVYTVDHYKLEVTSVENHPVDLMEQVKEFTSLLSKGVNAYVAKYYRTPFGSQIFADISETGMDVHIGFTSKNINIGKFYTGEWISKWKVNKDEIVGTVSIKAHFFEAGNVQFEQKRNLKQEFQFTADMQQNATNIVNVIEKFECHLQENLNTIYEEMPNKFFKKLRRLAPYTKTKMSWNLNSIKMNHNLIGSKH